MVDLVRGEPAFPNSAIEDFVIARGDGSPVFLTANVVDDLDEGITQVIRGEEHLSNTPKQQLLWEALGAKPPVWAHLAPAENLIRAGERRYAGSAGRRPACRVGALARVPNPAGT
ncbi:hypothetical protein GCM10022206_24040 [Streptomyces chiangmaiensis]